MKKLNYLSCILILWMTSFLSTAFAANFFIADTDGDEYYIGDYLGYELNNQKYYVEYYNIKNASSRPSSEGFLYYDNFYKTIKVILFENDNFFGFTLEGHWINSYSRNITFVNNQGTVGTLDLFPRDSWARKGTKNKRVKKVRKNQVQIKD